MDTTIRNLDKDAYRALKARAALGGKTIGEVLNEAIQSYLFRIEPIAKKKGSLRDLTPEKYPPGNKRLSEKIDSIVYGLSGNSPC
jgi:plasmid stability protein